MKKLLILSFIFTLVLGMMSMGVYAQIDMEGETIKIFHPEGEPEYYIDGPGVDRVDWVEDEYNVEIVFDTGNWETIEEDIMSGVLAGDVPYDAYVVQVNWVEELAAEGYLYNLNRVKDMQNFYEEEVPETLSFYRDVQFGDAIFGLPMVSDDDPFFPTHIFGLAWNKSEFDRRGLDSIYDLQENGEWNYENFKDLVLELTRDTNDDGEIDYWGYGLDNNVIDPWHFVHGNGGSYYRIEDGEPVNALFDPEAVDALELVAWMRDNDVISPMKESVENVAIKSEANHLFDYNIESEDEWGWVPYPTSENGPEKGYGSVWLNYSIVFPDTLDAERAEAQVEILSDLYYMTTEAIESEMSIDEYEERLIEEWAVNNEVSDQKSIENMTHMLQNKNVFDKHNYLQNTAEALHGMGWQMTSGDESPTEVLEQNEGSIQSALDDLFSDLGEWGW